MAWDTPNYSKHEYNLAGKVLILGEQGGMSMDAALEIINNWRSAHYHPLNVFQNRLRRKSKEVDGNSLVVQRIKRLHSIRHKLERFTSMRLIQMQDIGGCRAIVSTVEHLEQLVNIVASKDKKRSSRGIKHKLIDEKNYIVSPKESGYRGVHLVFSYQSDKVHEYDDLKIEIQFRTYIQHSWATAVETVGLFTGQALKSSIGEKDWLRFFSLASAVMAIHEGTPSVPGVPQTADELRVELRKLMSDLDVASHLRSYSGAMHLLGFKETNGDHYFLLELDTDKSAITVRTYKQGQFERASADYLAIEKQIKNSKIDAVLVSADSMTALKKAYPNYFLDTEAFLNTILKIIA